MAENYYYDVYANFTGGLKTFPPAYKLGDDSFRELNSLYPNSHGSLEMREGQEALFATLSGHEVKALTRATVSGGEEYLVYGTALPLSNIGDTYARDEDALTNTLISTVAPKDLSRFALFDNKVFWVGDVDLSTSQVLYYDGNTTRTVGVNPPDSAPVVEIFSPSSGTDAVVAIASDPVYYWVTFYDPTTGHESNPTTINGIFTPSNSLYQSSLSDPFRVTVESIPTSAGMWRRVYRQGGGLPSPRQVGQIDDDSTTDFEDNLSNAEARSARAMSFSHDPPPFNYVTDLTYLLVHKRRLLLFGETTVAISNLNEPWYYPLITTFPLTDGQVLPIDGDLTNPIRAACPIGGAVFIARAKDAWMLYGEDTDTFILSGVCTVGCIAPLSLVACGDIPVWLGPDRSVWAMTNTGPLTLSEGIRDTLKAIPIEYAERGAATYHRNRYLLSFPDVDGEGTGMLLIYDFTTKTWHEESGPHTTARSLYGDTGAHDGDEVLIGTTGDFLDPEGNPYVGVVRLYTDAVTPLPFAAHSGDLLFGNPHTDKKACSLRVMGTYVPVEGEEVTLTLTAIKERKDNTSTTITEVHALYPKVEGVLLDTDIDASLVGQRLHYRIAGVASFFQLDSVSFGYSVVGDRRA
jgi:hypothetical protein